MKISDTQKRVIGLMREGYSLGWSLGYSERVWLQLGGCGSGGKSENASMGTLKALIKRALLEESEYIYPVRIYRLTELGKTVGID